MRLLFLPLSLSSLHHQLIPADARPPSLGPRDAGEANLQATLVIRQCGGAPELVGLGVGWWWWAAGPAFVLIHLHAHRCQQPNKLRVWGHTKKGMAYKQVRIPEQPHQPENSLSKSVTGGSIHWSLSHLQKATLRLGAEPASPTLKLEVEWG